MQAADNQEQFSNNDQPVSSSNAQKFVKLKNLAAELGMSRGIDRSVRSRNLIPFKLKEGPNSPYYLTFEDAEVFRRLIKAEREHLIVPDHGEVPKSSSGVYFLEVPAYDGKARVKIGWSDKLGDRLSTYRTIVPDLRIMAIWHTSDSWMERAALKCAENLGKKVHQELFEFDDISEAITELSELFRKLGISASYHNQHVS